MEGMTVSEIAKILNITEHAVRKRIETLHVKPRSREALYDPSVLIAIAAIKMGRPKKEKKKEGEK
jgi:predicted ArsR family transcriptional regulator